MNSNSKGYFDFKTDYAHKTSFALDYLRQYYNSKRGISEDEKIIYDFIHGISSKLKNINTCIEVGCGPTLHHAIMLAPYIQSLELADYLEENLEQIQYWLNKDALSWDWKIYTKHCLEVEGLKISEENISKREELTRNRIKSLRNVNLLSAKPLGDENKQYDLVSAFYCTEEIALNQKSWQTIMKNLISLVKPEGWLLMSCLENSDFYQTKATDGTTRKLPCASINKNDLTEILKEFNFDLEKSVIKSELTPGQSEEGVPGVLITLAKKGTS